VNLLEIAIDLDVSDAADEIDVPPTAVAPAVSFVLSTYNRRAVLLQTLAHLEGVDVPHEVFVVDNASADGTAQAVARQFPHVRLIARTDNRGSCAKNLALPLARGQYVVFLDDDSYPDPGSVERMIARFDREPRLGAAVFTVTLPDGSRECSAYPDVFIGCGVAFRRDALRQVGGLPEDFFMQAEEYDLSLRLLNAGWQVRTFDDLHVTHLKTPGARYSERVTRLDVRNNLVLVARHFPEQWALPYAWDWTRRYWAIASGKRHRVAFLRGLVEGLFRIATGVGRHEVSPAAFEQFAKIAETRRRMSAAVQQLGLRRVLFVDYGKNLLAYRHAADACGLKVVAIADPKLAPSLARHRGTPLLADDAAAGLDFDAVIISNLSPVHARKRAAEWRTKTSRPVINLFE
jgi:GT2 family glycosyltransferase